MTIKYFESTDTLHIELRSADVRETRDIDEIRRSISTPRDNCAASPLSTHTPASTSPGCLLSRLGRSKIGWFAEAKIAR